MLALSRHVGQSLVFHVHTPQGVIEFKVTPVEIAHNRIQGDKVRIAIEAPANVRVFREELLAEGTKR
jgi:carbon storage regulator CsrA